MKNKVTQQLQDGSQNVNETDKQNSSELIQKEEIKDSPFMVITINEESFGCLGKYRITEMMKSKEEVIQDLERFTWNRIIQVIQLMNEINNEK